MPLRDIVAKFFPKPVPPVREEANKAAGSQDQKVMRDKMEADAQKAATTAIDNKQAELLRTHLTPELTPYGTQPRRPPSDEEARALAEKLVAAKVPQPAPYGAVKDDGKAKAAANAAATPVKDDDSDRLEAEEVTPTYIAEVIGHQAEHEVDADQAEDPASWTKEERATKVAERVAAINAEEASAALTHTKGGGRTL